MTPYTVLMTRLRTLVTLPPLQEVSEPTDFKGKDRWVRATMLKNESDGGYGADGHTTQKGQLRIDLFTRVGLPLDTELAETIRGVFAQRGLGLPCNETLVRIVNTWTEGPTKDSVGPWIVTPIFVRWSMRE